jgi:DNA-binding CsgD family transcriptional regulator
MIHEFAAGGPRMSANPIERLSNRELQILHMIGKGMGTRETAQTLNLSIKTIESHRQRIKRKLNLNTGSLLVRFAVSGLADHAGNDPPSARSAVRTIDWK